MHADPRPGGSFLSSRSLDRSNRDECITVHPLWVYKSGATRIRASDASSTSAYRVRAPMYVPSSSGINYMSEGWLGVLERGGYAFDPATVSRTSAFIDDHARKEERWRRKKNEKEKERIPDVNNPEEKEKAYRYTFLCSKVDTFPNATPLVSVVAILVWVSALRLSEMLLSILFLEKDNEDTRIVGRREMKIVSLFFFAFLWILTFLSFLFEFVKTSESCWDVFGIIFQLNNSITSNGKKKDQSRWNNLEMISNNLHSIPSLYLYYA